MIYNKISGFSDEIDSKIDVQFAVLKKLGIKYFEPRTVDGKNISELCDSEVLSLKEKMDKAGIRASSVGSPICKIKLTDNFEKHFELFKRVCDITKALDCKYIRIFSFYHNGGLWTDAEENLILKRLSKMINYADDKGIILLHENEKDIYGDTAKRCLYIMKNLSCNSFKAVFDPANFVQCGQNTIEAYNMLKDYIAYMHIKDAKKEDGSICPSGMGDGCIKEILSKLFSDGYNGFLSLEPHLGSFEGLKNLELDDKMEKLPKGGEGTFTLAHNALLDIIKEI